MKSFLLLIVVITNVFCQDSEKLVVYGNMGIGLSQGGFQDHDGGTVARLGVSLSMYYLHIKIDRTINNEPSIFEPPEKITSYSGLIGVSTQPFRNLPELFVVGKYGIGNGEKIKRGKIIFYRPFDDDYEIISEKYTTNILELDLELRFQYFGMYLGGFFEFNRRFDIYGVTVGAIFGNF
ncbi:MAG: hypothetical protein WDA22_17270 [Bacteroidota bacterium]